VKRRRRRTGPVGFFSTGSTLLNLVCSDKAEGGFLPGTIVNIVGDSAAGKSLLGLTILAEAANNSAYNDYGLIYDDIEAAMFFDVKKLFGAKLYSRIAGPAGVVGESRSDEIEEWYYHMDDLLDKGKPFVYVLDSMDALTSESERDKFQERKRAHRKGRRAAGSFGDGKSKVNSSHLRQIARRLRQTKSLVVIISQTRENIGISFAPKTHSGGKALSFYASHKIWLAVKQTLKKSVRGKGRTIGTRTKAKVSKNKATGRLGEIDFPIFYSYGLDDITSCIDYLISEGYWKKSKSGSRIQTDIGFQGRHKELVAFIEENGLYGTLVGKCETVWTEVVQACTIGRPGRYA